jgi:hypothetical protein
MNDVLVREYSSTDRQEMLDELQDLAQELKGFIRSLDSSEWSRDYGVRHKGAIITIQNTVDELITTYIKSGSRNGCKEKTVEDRTNESSQFN